MSVCLSVSSVAAVLSYYKLHGWSTFPYPFPLLRFFQKKNFHSFPLCSMHCCIFQAFACETKSFPHGACTIFPVCKPLRLINGSPAKLESTSGVLSKFSQRIPQWNHMSTQLAPSRPFSKAQGEERMPSKCERTDINIKWGTLISTFLRSLFKHAWMWMDFSRYCVLASSIFQIWDIERPFSQPGHQLWQRPFSISWIKMSALPVSCC